ncbi:FAD-dependent oxidoreductase [Alcaligenaceae bacterium CGII-47]|nr:FAD-dependent oxidoreductase [Alcaligenaceae bacterium CGII-47]
MADFPDIEPVGPAQRRTIIVIGAGVVGLSTAIWLQRAGHAVTIIDRHSPWDVEAYRGASSFGNACTMAFGACLPVAMPGILKQVPGMLLDRSGPLSIFWRDFPHLVPWLWSFIRSSTPAQVDRIVGVLGALLRAAEAGHASLIKEAGVSDLVRNTGCLYLFRNEQEFQQARSGIALREREGVRMEILSATQVAEREPRLAPRYHKGLCFLDVYSLDNPYRYVLGLIDVFMRHGGQFIHGEVDQIRRGESHIGVHAGPDWQAADQLVIAGGAWSATLAAMVGDRVRLDTERGYHVLFPEAGGLLHAPTCYPVHGFYMTPLTEGLRVAGTVELGGLGLPPRPVRTEVIERKVRRLLPDVGPAGRTWLGFRPSMPDSLPVIGASPTDARVIYAFGHGHIGLTLAGISGRMVAHLVNRQAIPLDLTPLRINRF